jgi:CRP-like cAMP-binding protein
LGTSWRDGRAFTLSLLGPGDWYGDIALIDNSPVDLDVVAQVHSTVLVVKREALRDLLTSEPELRHALLQLDCRRLRHMFRRLEELQTLPLSQRVALKLQRLLRQFGSPPALAPAVAGASGARQIELTLTQGDLAGLLCASRQRINGVLRQLQALGILGCSHGRIEVLSPKRLGDVASGRLVLETSGA